MSTPTLASDGIGELPLQASLTETPCRAHTTCRSRFHHEYSPGASAGRTRTPAGTRGGHRCIYTHDDPEARVRDQGRPGRLQHWQPRLRSHTHPRPVYGSMRLSHSCPPVSQAAHSAPFPLPLPPLWHRRAHCDGLCPLAADGLPFAFGPMSAGLLDQGLRAHAGAGRHGRGLRGGGH